MYDIGQAEIEAVARVIQSKKLFRYGNEGSECERFEKRYAEYLGVQNVRLTSSGTTAITAALVALNIGPGDEVVVPAQTYMASAVSVLAVGAIPVIVDIDETTTMDPAAFEDSIGPRTRAVMPVHMWGLSCDMDSILRIARKRNVLVIEDAAQAVGGGYEGKMLGSLGDAGAFSFNFYKNMSCGEGGAVVVKDEEGFKRAGCAVDCCRFYWDGRDEGFKPFTSNGSRASEIEGAILNVQLDRLPGFVETMRRHKRRVLMETAAVVKPSPCYSIDYETGGSNMFQLETSQQADEFAKLAGGTVVSKTGRHTYTEWDPILNHQGAHHPRMNPFNFPENRECRMNYSKDMCSRSLKILDRTVRIPNLPTRSEAEVTELIGKIKQAADAVSGKKLVGSAS